ncbi:unnamed protein product [Closterium sp. Naga37s-1]|nr:unnamed protein product [Closterium sp. Naga37s-1]
MDGQDAVTTTDDSAGDASIAPVVPQSPRRLPALTRIFSGRRSGDSLGQPPRVVSADGAPAAAQPESRGGARSARIMPPLVGGGGGKYNGNDRGSAVPPELPRSPRCSAAAAAGAWGEQVGKVRVPPHPGKSHSDNEPVIVVRATAKSGKAFQGAARPPQQHSRQKQEEQKERPSHRRCRSWGGGGQQAQQQEAEWQFQLSQFDADTTSQHASRRRSDGQKAQQQRPPEWQFQLSQFEADSISDSTSSQHASRRRSDGQKAQQQRPAEWQFQLSQFEADSISDSTSSQHASRRRSDGQKARQQQQPAEETEWQFQLSQSEAVSISDTSSNSRHARRRSGGSATSSHSNSTVFTKTAGPGGSAAIGNNNNDIGSDSAKYRRLSDSNGRQAIPTPHLFRKSASTSAAGADVSGEAEGSWDVEILEGEVPVALVGSFRELANPRPAVETASNNSRGATSEGSTMRALEAEAAAVALSERGGEGEAPVALVGSFREMACSHGEGGGSMRDLEAEAAAVALPTRDDEGEGGGGREEGGEKGREEGREKGRRGRTEDGRVEGRRGKTENGREEGSVEGRKEGREEASWRTSSLSNGIGLLDTNGAAGAAAAVAAEAAAAADAAAAAAVAAASASAATAAAANHTSDFAFSAVGSRAIRWPPSHRRIPNQPTVITRCSRQRGEAAEGGSARAIQPNGASEEGTRSL